MDESVLNWMKSASVGGVTEIGVMSPIRPGRIPGERRTYEERLRMAMASVQNRTLNGIPTELTRISTIHFGRMLIVRPEQYLMKSDAKYIAPDFLPDFGAPDTPEEKQKAKQVQEILKKQPQYRSWLFTMVVFDGDLKVYFRDIAEFLGEYFDRIFDNCEDFPSTSRFEEFWAWIKRYQVSSDLFHCAYPDLTAPRIKHLQDFKRQFDLFVEKVRSPTGRKVEHMDDLFDEFLRETQQYSSNFPAPGGVYLPRKGGREQ